MPKESAKTRPTIIDVARIAKVGTTSVTRFLNPKRRVELSLEIRQRVEKTIKELNYRPSASKRKARMTKKVTHTFGILTSLSKDIFHSRYHTEILSGIFDEIARTSHELKFFLLKNRHYERLEEILYDHGLDGLLILTWRIHPNLVKLVEESSGEFPLVIFNDFDPKLRVDIAYTDVAEGMRLAVGHLLEKGYKKIAMLKGPSNILFQDQGKTLKVPSIDALEKARGFINALKERNVPLKNKAFIRECASYLEGDGYQEMKKWLKEKRNLPEAIVCANDDIAIGALRALKEANLKCPKDIALVGFDDIEKAAIVTPSLTTVKQPLYQMGQDAVSLLIERVLDPTKVPEPKRYLPELVVRNTT